jgi:hypothetical protein
MKMKWPLYDEKYEDPRIRSAWFLVCTPVVEKVINEGYTVAISVDMSRRLGVWSHLKFCGRKIVVVNIPEDQHLKQVHKRSYEKKLDLVHMIEKMKSERSFCESISKVHPNTKLKEVPLYDEVWKYD